MEINEEYPNEDREANLLRVFDSKGVHHCHLYLSDRVRGSQVAGRLFSEKRGRLLVGGSWYGESGPRGVGSLRDGFGFLWFVLRWMGEKLTIVD